MPRGRRWSFDRDQALERAMLLFWERGYTGASLKVLQSAMGVRHPQSLISAFGSKPQLFRAALDLYWRTQLEPVLALLKSDDPAEAFDSLLDQAAHLFTAFAPARGCLILTGLVNATSEEAAELPWVAAYRTQISNLIAQRLARAVDDRDLKQQLEASLNEVYLTALHGMALRARAGASYEALVLGIDLLLDPLKLEI